jgi:hypothetical protein
VTSKKIKIVHICVVSKIYIYTFAFTSLTAVRRNLLRHIVGKETWKDNGLFFPSHFALFRHFYWLLFMAGGQNHSLHSLIGCEFTGYLSLCSTAWGALRAVARCSRISQGTTTKKLRTNSLVPRVSVFSYIYFGIIIWLQRTGMY